MTAIVRIQTLLSMFKKLRFISISGTISQTTKSKLYITVFVPPALHTSLSCKNIIYKSIKTHNQELEALNIRIILFYDIRTKQAISTMCVESTDCCRMKGYADNYINALS